MSIVVDATGTKTAPPSAVSIRALSIIEAGRYVTSPSLWIGLILSVCFVVLPNNDYSGQAYGDWIPLSVGPFAFGVYLAALRIGGRDRRTDRPALAEESPLDASERTIARLMGLTVPILIALLGVIVLAIVAKVDGGFWIGDPPRRTDRATHTMLELLQPPLLVANLGAAGVAIGRSVRRITPAVIIGFAIWFTFVLLWWAWNIPGLHVLAPVQLQPLSIPLGGVTDPNALPTGWLVDIPNEHNALFRRQVVHAPTVLGHHLYLFGVLGLWSGAAIRHSFGRRLMVGGLIVAAAGVAFQLGVSPF